MKQNKRKVTIVLETTSMTSSLEVQGALNKFIEAGGFGAYPTQGWIDAVGETGKKLAEALRRAGATLAEVSVK